MKSLQILFLLAVIPLVCTAQTTTFIGTVEISLGMHLNSVQRACNDAGYKLNQHGKTYVIIGKKSNGLFGILGSFTVDGRERINFYAKKWFDEINGNASDCMSSLMRLVQYILQMGFVLSSLDESSGDNAYVAGLGYDLVFTKGKEQVKISMSIISSDHGESATVSELHRWR